MTTGADFTELLRCAADAERMHRSEAVKLRRLASEWERKGNHHMAQLRILQACYQERLADAEKSNEIALRFEQAIESA